ncbi:hypothetical protein Caci_5695 [Catenulispora acidiphila DSM 44928]|uniref:Uncharacterized protein n=1 Tax=Catenulispora acidiphila (strain DSM 44928 / JCM 14897 / NBRC 102108 / NRRL B-24433 / ID139908) TaxID=479433 RepID=C7QCA5_CATAD|nr:hypothetical protein [Catenulispora acidiphila]ACU74553.1 hypothetical protein Caci_5695 [Catenulispora acidiphila DSM 44928]
MTLTDTSPTTSDPGSPAPMLPGVPRRGALRWLTGGGIALVGAVSGLFATAAPASASPLCCQLAYPNGPFCNYFECWFSCPSGYTKMVWTCASGSREIVCGECQQGGNTCWNGSKYVCSIYWDDDTC